MVDYALDILKTRDEMALQFGLQEIPHTRLAAEYLDLLLNGNRREAIQLVMSRVGGDLTIRDLYLNVIQRTQLEVGRLWQINRISVAQEHYCSAASQLVMSMLYPEIINRAPSGPGLIATCVSGELHEIGLRMVTDLLELEGWNTHYLGANTPAEDILRTMQELELDLLAISATMTYHVPDAAGLIEQIRKHPAGARARILVGGRPFNIDPALWKNIGADGYAPDAGKAVEMLNQLES